MESFNLLEVDHDCDLCIDGFQPAGTHPILGPVFIWCLADITCSGCYGHAVFPANSMAHIQNGWPVVGVDYTVTFCRVCQGITHIHTYTGGDPR